MKSAADQSKTTTTQPAATAQLQKKEIAAASAETAGMALTANPPIAPSAPPGGSGGTAQRKSSTNAGSFSAAVAQMKGDGPGLPDKLKAGVENLSGHSMDDVKVHYNSAQPANLQAHAYAQGSDVHVANGQEKHLPHEAWHAVQQAQGRVKPEMQMKMQPVISVAQRSESEGEEQESNEPLQLKAQPGAVAQRESEGGELEEEELQMKAQPGAVAQRESEGGALEEEELQMKAQPGAVAQRESEGGALEEEELQMKAQPGAVAQRESEGGALEEEELQMKVQSGAVAQRESEGGALEEEEELQMKAQPGAVAQRKETSSASSSGNSMPAEVQSKMESSMGADFSDVNIHANSSKASDLGAQAYAQGSDIHMAPGKYDPASTSGQELLGHELAHVIQQREGRVKPTIQAKGVPVNDDAGLEREADVIGAKAARSAAPVQKKPNHATTIGPMPLQRKGVAQLAGGESNVAEPEVEGNERDEEEDAGNDVPIPDFPSVNAQEVEENEAEAQEGPQEQAPPLPPRPQAPQEQAPRLPPRPQKASQAPPLPLRPQVQSVQQAPPLPPRPQAQQAPPLPPRPQATPQAQQAPPPPPPGRMIKPEAGKGQVNYNDDGKQDYAEYGILGSGGAAAGASATTKGLQYGDTLVNKGYDLGNALKGTVPEASQFGETASAVSGLGIAGGALGTIGAVADGVRAGQYIANKDKVASDRVMGGGGAMLSAGGSALKESSTMAFHAATLAKDATAMGGAAAAAGIGSVAMGGADIIRGTYGAVRADQRATRLRGVAEWTESEDVYSAAKQAESTQEIRKAHAKGTIFKGLLLVGGGATLIIMGANPIGWGLLAGAAIVGGIIALRRYLAKRARKKDVAVRELGVTAEYNKYKEEKKARSMFTRNKPPLVNPLDKAMTERGYKPKDYGKFYADYIHDTAWVMYNLGVLGDQGIPENKQMREVILNMGLKVQGKESPKPMEIAKNLHA